MEANDGRCKMVVGKMGTPDFDIASYSNSRNNLFGNSYEYEMISDSPYPPFGEVVDYTENSDGTITLIVDGVWADYNSDCAFTNRIVVQPFEDGTFRYLANSIEQKELELPVIARMNP